MALEKKLPVKRMPLTLYRVEGVGGVDIGTTDDEEGGRIEHPRDHDAEVDAMERWTRGARLGRIIPFSSVVTGCLGLVFGYIMYRIKKV